MSQLNSEEEKQFYSFLNSSDDSNVILAIQIIKTLELTLQIEEELVIVAKTHPNNEIRSSIRKILEKKGNPKLFNLYKDTIAFIDIAKGLKEKDIRDKMTKIVQKSDWDSINYLCILFFKRFEKGLSHLLGYPEYNSYRINALRLLTNDGILDFHKGIGYQDRRNLSDDDKFVYWQEKLKISFPKDHPDPLSIKSIIFHNCKLHSLSADIKIFENVESLDLSCNYLKSLPPALGKLSKLKNIDVSFNYFENFPNILLKIKNLKSLNIRGNNKMRTSLEVPDEFLTNNPNCEISI